MDTSNRIFFKDNPYPNGHKIKKFVWNGRLDSELGLWFDFHLETEDYYAEDNANDDEDVEPESDWKAKIVWENYQSCTMSSTKWHCGGILVGTSDDKFNFAQLQSKPIFADKLPLIPNWDYENLSFHIYLLGHDSCADHEITFLKKPVGNVFDIQWKGKIAQTYIGSDEFKREFIARVEDVEFAGFRIDKSSLDKIKEMLERFVTDKEIYKIEDGKILIK